MRTGQSIADLQPTDILAIQIGGEFVFYEPGDELPPEPTPESASRMLTVHEFRTRFTDAELAAIALRAYGGAGDALAAVLLLKLQTRTEIDLDDPALIAGLNYLVSVGVLATSRQFELRA